MKKKALTKYPEIATYLAKSTFGDDNFFLLYVHLADFIDDRQSFDHLKLKSIDFTIT